jgi:phosphocarrier protein HPr
LGVDTGDEVVISAEGENAEQVVTDLATLLESDLDAA